MLILLLTMGLILSLSNISLSTTKPKPHWMYMWERTKTWYIRYREKLMKSSLIQIFEHNMKKIAYTIKDKSFRLLSFMERETRLVSCSLAFNGNSVFCLQGFQPLQQKHSSLSSLTQLALSLVRRPWLKLIKRSPFQDFSLLAGDETVLTCSR